MLLLKAKMISLPSNQNSKGLIQIASSMVIKFHSRKFYTIWIESVLEQIIFFLLFFLKRNQEMRLKKDKLTGILGKMNFISRSNLLKSSKWRKDRKRSKRNHKSILKKSKKSLSNYIEFLKKVRK